MNILTLDVETAPHKGTFWQLFKTTINPVHVEKPTYMLSWAAKWYGKRQVLARRVYDPDFLSELHALMCQADAIVTFNGDGFDLKHINREFAKYGLPPVRPCASIDLYKIVKSTFALPSNRLDYVCQYFLDKGKLDTGGFELWQGVMRGDEAAWKKMIRYNKRDVTLTEELYAFLRPWIRKHPFAGTDVEPDDAEDTYTCPACGSDHTIKDRPRRTRCYAVRVVSCKECGNYFDGKRKKI